MITLVVGLPGSGKSLFIHDWIRSRPDYRYFVVEHSNEWELRAPHWRGRPPRVIDVWRPRDVFEMHKAGQMPPGGVFRCINMLGWDVARLAIAFGPSVYVDDEIDVAGRQSTWTVKGNPLPDIVHRGRHLSNAFGQICEVHCIGAGRRPQNMATDLTDVCNQVFLFRVKGSRTLNRLEQDDAIDSEEREVVRNLPKFHWLHSPSGRRGSIAPL